MKANKQHIDSKHHIYLYAIIVLAAIVRFINIYGRMPFGWDQERDIFAVAEIVRDFKPKLIGPVVKGDGGFMLGPLYYYILAPISLLTKLHPIGLGITSVLLDLASMLLLYKFLKQYINHRTALISTAIWSISVPIVSLSLISWNVSLISIYTIITMYITTLLIHEDISQSKRRLYLTILMFMTGLSLHIHASVFGLVPLATAFTFIWYLVHKDAKNKLNKIDIKHKDIPILIFFLLLPITPMVLFDVRHDFINIKLLKQFLSHSPLTHNERYIFVLQSIATKYIHYISDIFFDKANKTLSYITASVVLFAPIFINKLNNLKNPNTKNASATNMIIAMSYAFVLYITSILLIYRDPFFPEYYFTVSLAPIIILASVVLNALMDKNRVAFATLSAVFILSVFMRLSFEDKHDSLKHHESVVERISRFSNKVDIRYELPLGRNVGFKYLLQYHNITVNEDSRHKVIIKSSEDDSSVNGARKVFDEWVYGYRILGFIVE